MKQVRQALEGSVTLGPELRLLARVLDSQTFHRSARLRDLLREVVEQTLAGHPERLTEHALGVRVFERPEGYNPADDNIVRASARQLRLKLKEYFETEGAGETLVVEIPKGGYTAVFALRTAVEDGPGERRRLWWPWAVLGVSVAVLGWAFMLWREARTAMPELPPTVFTELFRQHPGPVQFVLTDSALVLQNEVRGGTPDLDSYASRSFIEEFAQQQPGPESLRWWKILSTRQITSLADVGILAQLLQVHPALSRRVMVQHARHMTVRDLKQGNHILTGSYTANPWSRLFEEQLHFPLLHGPGRFTNRNPREGEKAEYVNDWAQYRLPSRVAVVPNLSGQGFVLLVAGAAMESTEGAGEFLHRGDALPAIRKALALGDGEALPYFELLLETSATRGTARRSKIVAARRH